MRIQRVEDDLEGRQARQDDDEPYEPSRESSSGKNDSRLLRAQFHAGIARVDKHISDTRLSMS